MRRAVKWGSGLASAVGISLVVAMSAMSPAAADGTFDIESFLGISLGDDGCVDFVSQGIGFQSGGSRNLTLDVQGPPVAAVMEWSGQDDLTPAAVGESTLGLAVTSGPGGSSPAADVVGQRLPGDAGSAVLPLAIGPPVTVYAWAADVTDRFAGGAGTYEVAIDGWTSNVPVGEVLRRAFGVTVTVVYSTGACDGPIDITWTGGIDKYYGGLRPADEIAFGGAAGEGHTTGLFVFPVEAAPISRDAVLQLSAGGVQNNPDRCREASLWYAAGSGTPPGPDDELVTFETWGEPFGVAATGGVEVLRNPFANPANAATGGCIPELNPTDSVMEAGHACPNGPDATCPYRATSVSPTGGGYRTPEWALTQVGLVVPAGATWVALQIESPTDLPGRTTPPVPPESGVWAGQMLLAVAQAPVEGALQVRKVEVGLADGERDTLPVIETYTATVDCTDDAFDQEVTIGFGLPPVIVDGLPLGTECTVTEQLPTQDDVPPGVTLETVTDRIVKLTDGSGISVQIELPGPQTVTITDADVVVDVAVENGINTTLSLGDLIVRKDVVGTDDAAVTGTTFEGTVVCDRPGLDQLTQPFTFSETVPFFVSGLPFGSTCTVTETAPGAPFGTPTYSPGQTVTVTEATPVVEVLVTNPVGTGSLSVFKVERGLLDGERDDLPLFDTYTATVDCDGDSFDRTVVIGVEVAPVVIDGIPVGTECTVDELVPTEAPAGTTLEETTIEGQRAVLIKAPNITITVVLPNAQTVTVAEAGTTVEVEVANDLLTTRSTENLQIRKLITGARGILSNPGDVQFTAVVVCDLVPGVVDTPSPLTATVTFSENQPGLVQGLPIGSTCTVTENVPTGDIEYADAVYQPGQTITIGADTNLNVVTVNNGVLVVQTGADSNVLALLGFALLAAGAALVLLTTTPFRRLLTH